MAVAPATQSHPETPPLPGGKVVVYTGILPITRTEAGLTVALKRWLRHCASLCPKTWNSCTQVATRCRV